MRRPHFLLGLGALAGAAMAPALARAADNFDPATSAAQPSLRVLLGSGNVQAVGASRFLYDGRPYRGSFERLPDGRVLNIVTLEAYLRGVIAREMSPGWPTAALAAQAIAARTYVLTRSDPQRTYDLIPSQADQVYLGIDAESAPTNAAVVATAGQVLRFGGGYAQVAYSSCCGGDTESAHDAWGGLAPVYLQGVIDPYCAKSPWYRWRRRLDLHEVQARYAAVLAGAALTELTLIGSDASGRARQIGLQTAAMTIPQPASAFRLRVGTRRLPSLLILRIDPAQADGTVAIEGGGLGHGVGLCQWGAHGMAAGGASAAQILAWYFPGTHIGNE